MTTNYERIKSMNIEELARLSIRWNGQGYMCLNSPIIHPILCDAYKANIEWLQAEAEE